MKYRKERLDRCEAKHWHEPVQEEADSLEEALMAAAQSQEHDRPVYRELVKPGEVNQQGATR